MHKEFSDWYRLVNPDPSGELLEKRWAAIEILSKDSTSYLDLLRIAIQSTATKKEYIEKFDNEFQKTDKAFRITNNQMEHSLLACSAICNILDKSEHEGQSRVAIATFCLDCFGSRANEATLRVSLVERAKHRLSDLSSSLRMFSPANSSKGAAFDAVSQFKKFDEQVAANPPTAALQELAGITRQIIKINNELYRSLNRSETIQMLLSEELNMLWWLTNGTSRCLSKPFKEIPPDALSLVAGLELGDLTSIEPGPLGIASLIERLLREAGTEPEQQVPIGKAVGALGKSDCQKLFDGFDLGDLVFFCPIHDSLREAQKSDRWEEAFKYETGVDAALQSTKIAMACQAYFERLLLKDFSDREKKL